MAELVEFRKGVQCHVLACNAKVWHGIQTAALVAPRLHDDVMVVTSISDGVHTTPQSRHYVGLAFDIRYTRRRRGGVLKTPQYKEAKLWAMRLQAALGNDWDVVLKKDHIHVEYDPK